MRGSVWVGRRYERAVTAAWHDLACLLFPSLAWIALLPCCSAPYRPSQPVDRSACRPATPALRNLLAGGMAALISDSPQWRALQEHVQAIKQT